MSFTTANKEVLDLFIATGKEVPTEDSNMGRAVAILQEIIDQHSHSVPDITSYTNDPDGAAEDIASDASHIFDALEELEGYIAGSDDDFNLEFDGAEYRLIGSDEETIWPIYRDAIQETVEDCYSEVLDLSKIPNFIAVSVDWEQTAKNAYADGYGHQFSGYDGSEHEAGGYYIFRTN